MEEEIWKSIIGNYKVSNLGNFKNAKTGRYLKPYKDKHSYLRIRFKGTTQILSRVVAYAFPEICGKWFELKAAGRYPFIKKKKYYDKNE